MRPKHGLHILPLDGTFTPTEGDHLWRTDDHAHTMRELRRWSINDAEAYEEYGQLMAQMARFIKPILAMTPTDPRQAPMLLLMPLMMVFFFYGLPSGLVLYWTMANLLAIARQMMLKAPTAPAVGAPAAEFGVLGVGLVADVVVLAVRLVGGHLARASVGDGQVEIVAAMSVLGFR